MPIYDFKCDTCDASQEQVRRVDQRDVPSYCSCGGLQLRQLAAPMGRVWGVIPKGGGPDKFTADMLGIPLKELPPGLRADKGESHDPA